MRQYALENKLASTATLCPEDLMVGGRGEG